MHGSYNYNMNVVYCPGNIPMIPDIEDMQEEDLVAQLAAPPRSV